MPSTQSVLSVLAAQLTLARCQQHLTQRDLAEVIGRRQAQVCSWENLDLVPTLVNLIAWADGLGYDVALIRRAG